MRKRNVVRLKVGRDAYTGHFVPVAYAKANKRTAVVETIVKKKVR